MYEHLAILAVIAFLYSTIAGGLERTPISGPILFIVVGLLLGPIGLGWFSLTQYQPQSKSVSNARIYFENTQESNASPMN